MQCTLIIKMKGTNKKAGKSIRMPKQVYNFEVFSNKKDELKRIHKKQRQKEWAKRFFFIALALFCIFILYMLNNSRSDYYVYKEETETESNDDVTYETFARGYVKYSKNGIEYQKRFGVAEWNISVSYQNPYLVKSDSYILLADKSSNELMIFDVDGKVGELTLKYPIVQADISNQGVIEVILQGEESNFIQVYDIEGNIIAEMKSSIDETGYPVTAAISPDGTKLVVSYFTIDGLSSKTTITFYDFSKQLQTDSVSLVGGFDYEDCLIPRLKFTSNHILVAIGDSVTYYYDISDEPEVEKEVSFEEEIQSIFIGDDYIGYVLDNSEQSDEEKYRICLYTKRGIKKLDTTLDMNYESIEMRGRQIIAVRDNECMIMNIGGKVIFQDTLDGSTIEAVLPAWGWRTYQVVFRDKIVKMQLRFWSTDSKEEEES